MSRLPRATSDRATGGARRISRSRSFIQDWRPALVDGIIRSILQARPEVAANGVARLDRKPSQPDDHVFRKLSCYCSKYPVASSGFCSRAWRQQLRASSRLPWAFNAWPRFKQRFGEVGSLGQRFLIKADRVFMLTRFLKQQAGVVEQFRRALARFDQLRLQVESFVQILAFNGQRGQSAQRVDRMWHRPRAPLQTPSPRCPDRPCSNRPARGSTAPPATARACARNSGMLRRRRDDRPRCSRR